MNKLDINQCRELLQFGVKTFCTYPGALRTVGLVTLIPLGFIADLFAQVYKGKKKYEKSEPLANRKAKKILKLNKTALATELQEKELKRVQGSGNSLTCDSQTFDYFAVNKSLAMEDSHAFHVVEANNGKYNLEVPAHYYTVLQKLFPDSDLLYYNALALTCEKNALEYLQATHYLIEALRINSKKKGDDEETILTIKCGKKFDMDEDSSILTLSTKVLVNFSQLLSKLGVETKNFNVIIKQKNVASLIECLFKPKAEHALWIIDWKKFNKENTTHHLLGTIFVVGATLTALVGGVLKGNRKVVYYATKALRAEAAAYVGIGACRGFVAYLES